MGKDTHKASNAGEIAVSLDRIDVRLPVSTETALFPVAICLNLNFSKLMRQRMEKS